MSLKNKVLLLILTIVIIFFIIQLSKGRNQLNQSIAKNTPSQVKKDKFQSRKNEGGNVTVTAIPDFLQVGKQPKFKLEFNTHSVELSFDIAKQSYLLDDGGNRFSDAAWTGTPPEGHHRSGTLVFNQLLGKTEFVELVLIDIAGIPERKFRWEF